MKLEIETLEEALGIADLSGRALPCTVAGTLTVHRHRHPLWLQYGLRYFGLAAQNMRNVVHVQRPCHRIQTARAVAAPPTRAYFNP